MSEPEAGTRGQFESPMDWSLYLTSIIYILYMIVKQTIFVGRDDPGAVWRSWYCVGYGTAWKLKGRKTSGQWHRKSFMMTCTQIIVQEQLYFIHRYRNSEHTYGGLVTRHLMFSFLQSCLATFYKYSRLEIREIPYFRLPPRAGCRYSRRWNRQLCYSD